MGLNNSNYQKRTFLNIVGGKFARTVPEGTEGAVARKNKKDAIVYELLYDTLDGVRIKHIEKKKNAFGASWEVVLAEADEEFMLMLPYSGRTTSGLLFRLPNIDFSSPVTLKLFTSKEGKIFLTVYDMDDVKIEPAYTKDNPNGLPPLEKKKIKGVEDWDDTLQMEFIEHMIETTIKPKLLARPVIKPAADPIDPDDLPF